MRRWLLYFTQPFFLGVYLLWTSGAAVAADMPDVFREVGITENLGGQVDLSLQFQNEQGEKVPLSTYFHSGKPVLLTMVYYRCPNLCNYLLNGLTNSLRALEWSVGKEFDMVTVSINPKEGSDLAREKRDKYIQSYGRLDAKNGWSFLTGSEENITQLSQQVGFGFKYDEQTQEYAHGAVVFVLTPEGKISRYLYGIDFPRKDLKLSLLEASSGKIGNVLDRVLMFCYKYDPSGRGYSLYVTRIMKAGGVLTIFALGGYLAFFWGGQRRLARKRRKDESSVERG